MSRFTRSEALAILEMAFFVAEEGVVRGGANDEGASRDRILDEIREEYPDLVEGDIDRYVFGELYGSVSIGRKRKP